jgi:hypothetical protein
VYFVYIKTQLSEKPAEPEETSEDTNPFTGMEIASDTEDSDNYNAHSDIAGSSDDNCSDVDDSGDTDVIMEDALAHDILLDSVANSEDENSDPEDDSDIDIEGEEELEIWESQEGDGIPAEFNHGFSGAELGIVPPQPTPRTADQHTQRYTAGCMWTAENWSCSYDAVFMAFWSLYEQSSTSWHDDWMRFAPDWNGPLGNNFDHLILLANTSVGAQDRAEWFCRYRDCFRDQLSHADPSSFPRRGQLSASASRILEAMFGRSTGPYLEQHLACTNCEMPSQTEREIGLLTMGLGCNRETPVSLQTVLTTFVHRAETDVHRLDATCSHCQGPNKVEGVKMPAVPWIWFERDRCSPVGPSLALTFDSQPLQLNYSLRAIIYSGQDHFTIRFRERSGRWWTHDGRVASGVPQPDDIRSEVDLLTNRTRFACILIYRRDDR